MGSALPATFNKSYFWLESYCRLGWIRPCSEACQPAALENSLTLAKNGDSQALPAQAQDREVTKRGPGS